MSVFQIWSFAKRTEAPTIVKSFVLRRNWNVPRRSCCLCLFVSYYCGIDFEKKECAQKIQLLKRVDRIFWWRIATYISPMITNWLYLTVLDAKNRVFCYFATKHDQNFDFSTIKERNIILLKEENSNINNNGNRKDKTRQSQWQWQQWYQVLVQDDVQIVLLLVAKKARQLKVSLFIRLIFRWLLYYNFSFLFQRNNVDKYISHDITTNRIYNNKITTITIVISTAIFNNGDSKQQSRQRWWRP